MKSDKAIIVESITKKYKMYDNPRERLLDLITPKSYGRDFYALTNIDFEAKRGEVIGFIGTNGSGKSTLSNIIAGIVPETSGRVTVNGEVSLIAVAAGLKADLTGRENIELKLLMLGFNKSEIHALESSIIDFSELGQFIDQPVKSYSSGMKSRLGFSISVNVNPDILIIDEALSVGDKAFAEKSLNKMKEFKSEGKTMIFVSHSLGQMRKFCDKILWLEFGKVKDYGIVEEVIPKYEEFLKVWQIMSEEERNEYKHEVAEKEIQSVNRDNEIGVRKYIKTNKDNISSERPVSILGHIRRGDSFIYETPQQPEQAELSHEYQDFVYYIKKQMIYNNERFYLLSNKPSANDGVIGWMKASNISAHRHVIVDCDVKCFEVIGDGKAFNLPWGGQKNCVLESMKGFIGCKFYVNETNIIGNNVWYKGKVDNYNDYIWMHESFLTEL